MSAMLDYCGCGHGRDEHAAGACSHLNAGKKFASPTRCTCARFGFDERLRDSDDFVGKVLQKVVAREGIPFEPVEWEEAMQVLRIALWKTSVKYDSRSHVRFRVYAYLELFNDAIDHFRSERGRHGQHRVFDPRDIDGFGDGAFGGDRLGGAASVDPADNPDAWAADAGGLLEGADRGQVARVGGEGGGDVRRDARRDPRPGGVAGGPARAARQAARGGAAGEPAAARRIGRSAA